MKSRLVFFILIAGFLSIGWSRGAGWKTDGNVTVKQMKATGQYYSEMNTADISIDWNDSNVQYLVLSSGANVVTMATPKNGGRYAIILKQPAGGDGTVTWPATVFWPSNIEPTLTAANGAIDVIALIYDGTNGKYYGTYANNMQ